MCRERGDLQGGFAESDYVLEGEMRVGGQVRLFYLKSKLSIDNCQVVVIIIIMIVYSTFLQCKLNYKAGH